MITSVDNKKIIEISKLKTKKYRNNLFLVEGKHLVEEAYKHGVLEEVYSLNECDYKKSYVISKNVMRKISSLESIPNIVGVCHKLDEKEIGSKLLILDNIQNPGNLGTIIRSAVAFNIDTIVLSKDTVDLYNPKVIRSTEGMIFNINIIVRDLVPFIKKIKSDYKIYGTDVNNGIDVKNVEIKGKCAIIMGNEGNGIKKDILSLCDDNIYIKMNPLCESLNVGVATSIILYEINK